MLDNYKNSPDSRFAEDIHSISLSLSTMSQSLAVIAGVLARRDGLNCQIVKTTSIPDPLKTISIDT